ncbi:MAG: hypothetical protein ACRDDH_18050 [Cetobacterium sp.]|uniref:hypothetical protein n=1 Tax=Cetobacterium sp. TaxID=2071632 RepID=UPI003EE816F9
MNYKLQMIDSNNQKKEIKFNFKSLDNQFKASQIIFALNKKFPGALDKMTNKQSEVEKISDSINNMEILLYAGNLIMENCDSYEIDNKLLECKDLFKTKEGVEDFFKYALSEYLKLTGDMLGFAFENMSKSQ